MSLENLPEYKLYQLVPYCKINDNGQIKVIGPKPSMFDSKTKLLYFIKTHTVFYYRLKIVVFPYVDDDDNEMILFDSKNPHFDISKFPKTMINKLVQT